MHVEDRLGRLSLTDQDITARDSWVLAEVRAPTPASNGGPGVMIVHGAGPRNMDCPPKTMGLITSDHGLMCCRSEHQMALITSGCLPSSAPRTASRSRP